MRIALNIVDPLSERTYTHVAFHIKKRDKNKHIERIKNVGAETRPGRPRADNEG
ncbi:MAG: hypothetical protein FWC95_04345 [Defluviitaleaceae bacterium]|nr:hypothetical protein [Defluviitaleaceae bacterium]